MARGKEVAEKNIRELDRLLAVGELSEADHAREKGLALSKLSAQEVDLHRLLSERRPAVPPPPPTASPGWVQETRLSDEEVAFFVEHGCEHVPLALCKTRFAHSAAALLQTSSRRASWTRRSARRRATFSGPATSPRGSSATRRRAGSGRSRPRTRTSRPCAS